ncbi:hypothetical protein A3H19_00425 [Candidatus Woesebacteria bacterium RIFCSPLOWO2_12_FULL_39_9]|nr:MAG: hypothetical protein A3H19_00425 [Candidatus Woesebacteria bacterium RIFCSPLOWO2_12_FULL_39_9]
MFIRYYPDPEEGSTRVYRVEETPEGWIFPTYPSDWEALPEAQRPWEAELDGSWYPATQLGNVEGVTPQAMTSAELKKIGEVLQGEDFQKVRELSKARDLAFAAWSRANEKLEAARAALEEAREVALQKRHFVF